MSFRGIRIALLLVLLALAAGMTLWERIAVTQWLRPLEVVIYPVNGDAGDDTRDYLTRLDQDRFREIQSFIQGQSERYAGAQRRVAPIRVGREIREIPPTPPSGARGVLDSLLWSMRLRYYAFRHTPFLDSLGQVRLFVVYHQGEEGKPLRHSLGLRKGLIGVVHVFARRQQDAQNNVIITHELLHTLGASDKYDEQGMPLYPEGFADPGDAPRYPQKVAEIMAGRIARSPEHAVIPGSLDDCAVGYRTAYEINW